MLQSFSCPVCGKDDWRTVHHVHYAKSDVLPPGPDGRRDYYLLRRHVLFALWFPGKDAVRLRSVMCRGCGFMTYAPRPSAEDIEAKYRFLLEAEPGRGGAQGTAKAMARDRRRAKRVFRTVMRHGDAGRIRVLDYGGGDGKLLAPFSRHGHECALIDYGREPLPGIERIGESVADLPAGRTFDAIICSHVLEHVAQPAPLLRSLSDHLHPEGVLYAEVPLECWRGIGIGLDPVTHVNFFNFGNFLEMIARQGLAVIEGRRIAGTYGDSRLDVAFAVARKGTQSEGSFSARGSREAELLLAPSGWMEVRRRLRLRRWPTMRGLLARLQAALAAAKKPE